MSELIPLWKCPKCGTAFKDLEEAKGHLKTCDYVPVYRIVISRGKDDQWLPNVELVHHSVVPTVTVDVCRHSEDDTGDFIFELYVRGKESISDGVKKLSVYGSDVVSARIMLLEADKEDILGIIMLEEHTCRK